MTTRRELEKVERVDRRRLHTGDVAESLDELPAIRLGVVDNERATALAVTTVTQLTLTGTDLAGLLDLDEVGTGTDGLQQSDGSLGLGDGGTLEGLGLDNQGDFRNTGDAVTAGEQERRNRGSSQGRSGSEAPVIRQQLKLHPSRMIEESHFWPRLIFWCHFLHTLVGANIRPDRHWLPKAA